MSQLEKRDRWLFGMVELINENVSFPILDIYGPIITKDKLLLWKEITEKIASVGSNKIILAGDFNANLETEEKYGGNNKKTREMDDFRDFFFLK